MNLNHGKYWAGMIADQIARECHDVAYTDFDKNDSSTGLNIWLKPKKTDEGVLRCEAYVFPPELAGEKWEVLLINLTTDPMPDDFNDRIRFLATELGAKLTTKTFPAKYFD